MSQNLISTEQLDSFGNVCLNRHIERFLIVCRRVIYMTQN